TLVQNAVAGDTKDDKGNGKKDFVLKLAYVLDSNQKVITYCHEGTTMDCKVFDEHVPVAPALGQVIVDSWQKTLAAWKENAADPKKGGPLVQFQLTSGTSD